MKQSPPYLTKPHLTKSKGVFLCFGFATWMFFASSGEVWAGFENGIGLFKSFVYLLIPIALTAAGGYSFAAAMASNSVPRMLITIIGYVAAMVGLEMADVTNFLPGDAPVLNLDRD